MSYENNTGPYDGITPNREDVYPTYGNLPRHLNEDTGLVILVANPISDAAQFRMGEQLRKDNQE